MPRRILLIAALAGALLALPAAASTPLGQTALNVASVDGARVPAGTTLLSPSIVATGDYPAAVHLATGQTVNLGPNSRARLAATADGRISLAAESGTIEVGAETGEVFRLAANTVAMLEDDEPGSGDRVLMINVCNEDDELIQWDANELESCAGCYLPDYNDPGDPDDDECKDGVAAWLIAGAAIGGGVLVLNELDEDDNRPVLCGVPDASGNVPAGTNPPGVGGCPP